MSDSIDVHGLPTLSPCPFCGGPAEIARQAPGGTGASGMEPYMQRAGCKQCSIWTGWRHPKEEWGKQSVHDKRLSAQLAEHWNNRATMRQSGEAVLWKPIETAPKDGRPVLATTGHYSVFTTRWEDGEWYDDMQLVRDPVYWMPLPVAPGSESAPPATSGLVEAARKLAAVLPDGAGLRYYAHGAELHALRTALAAHDASIGK